jgi:CRISPR/Cas system-associated exonuclease Cas4 (RecB family)
MAVPKSDILYHRIKASDLASYYWCAEQSYWRLRGVERKEKPFDVAGRKVHADLVTVPEKDYEVEFFRKLKQFMPIYRQCGRVKVFCGFDAVDLSEIPKNNSVRLLEFKTTSMEKVPDFYIPQAKFQLEIYYWAYKPIIAQMGYVFPEEHFLEFRSSANGALMERIGVKMDELEIGRRIMDCLSVLGTGADFSKPEPFKCEWCDPEFKQKCRLRQG